LAGGNPMYTSPIAHSGTFDSSSFADGLCGHGFDMDVPDLGDHNRRIFPSSAASAGARDRFLLERLLKTVVGSNAVTIADELLERYGNLSKVLVAAEASASKDKISQLLTSVRDALVHCARFEIDGRPLLSTGEQLVRYLVVQMAGLMVEEVRVIFLNSSLRLVRDKVMFRGSIDRAPMHVREVLKCALECGATTLIVAHNHPSGCTLPSNEDVKNTRRLISACAAFDISVQDHVIVSPNGWTSMKAEGLL
jgi:DNA repair protein RadC